jgi:hypothetical protein
MSFSRRPFAAERAKPNAKLCGLSSTLTSIIKLDQSTLPHAEDSLRRNLRGLRELLAHQLGEASNLSQGHGLRIDKAQSGRSA